MITDEAVPTVRRKYQALSNIMDQRVLRLWAASEALALGWGGITAVAEATGLSHSTIPVARLSVQVPLQPAGRRVLVPLRCEVPPAPPHQPGEQATGVRRRHRPGVLRRRRELEPVRLARSDQPLGRRLTPGGRGCGTPKPRSDGQGSVA